MATQKTISRTVTVSTVEDGVSQPSYIQTQEAWSNVESTASATTRPSDCANSVWKDYTPANTSNRAYLWRRSRKMTFNETTRTYTAGSWSYQRLSGTNGTSISVKGHVATVSALPTTHADGDAYVVDADRHLYLWSAESGQWLDLGEFKGEAGATFYTHIAWAETVTFTGTPPEAPDGQTTTPNATAVTGFSVSPGDSKAYMGVLVNGTVADETNALLYTWNSVLGKSIEAQYSKYKNPSASSDIHTEWQTGDLYMRTRATGGTWSSWQRIVGESGDETDYAFGASAQKTTENVATPPSDVSSWADAPVAVSTSNPYLWMRMIRKTWNADTGQYVSGTTQYIRMTGEKTYTGVVELSRSAILYNGDTAGAATGAQTFVVGYALKAGGTTVSVSATAVTLSIPSGMTVVSKGSTECTLRVNNGQTVSGVVTVSITATYDGQDVSASAGVTVEGRMMGVQGLTGRIGRSYYFADEWASGKEYVLDDTQGPYVLGPDDRFYILTNAANGGDNVTSKGQNPTYGQYQGGAPWSLMTSEHKYYIAEAMFAQFAKLGSAIFNRDWMYSQWGMKGGVVVKDQYQKFSPSFLTTGWQSFVNMATATTVRATTYGTVTCIGGESYTVRLRAAVVTNTSYAVTVYVRDSLGSEVARATVSAISATTVDATWTAASGGEYTILVGKSAGTGTIYYLGVMALSPFVPSLALDLLTGRAWLNDVIMTGYMYKREREITPSNMAAFFTDDGNGNMHLNLQAAGSCIRFRNMTELINIWLPSINPANNSYTQAELDEARSYVGNTLLIYNSSDVRIGIVSSLRRGSTGAIADIGVTFPPGSFVCLTCKMEGRQVTANTETVTGEAVFWEYTTGTHWDYIWYGL